MISGERLEGVCTRSLDPPFFCLFKTTSICSTFNIMSGAQKFQTIGNHWDLILFCKGSDDGVVLMNFRAKMFETVFVFNSSTIFYPNFFQPATNGPSNQPPHRVRCYTTTRIAFGFDDTFPREDHTMSIVHQQLLDPEAGTRREGC